MTLKVDVILSPSVVGAAERAKELKAMGGRRGVQHRQLPRPVLPVGCGRAAHVPRPVHERDDRHRRPHAGRHPDHAEVIVGIVHTNEELQRARAVRNLLAFYGSTPAYRPVLDVEGWGDLQPELNTLSKQGEWDRMAELVTDELLDTLAVDGTPAQAAKEIVERYGADCQRVCASFPMYEASDELVAEFFDELKGATQTVLELRQDGGCVQPADAASVERQHLEALHRSLVRHHVPHCRRRV